MKILLAGSSGLVGTRLKEELKAQHEVSILVRREPQAHNEIQWEPQNAKIDVEKIENFDAVIHLGGVNIADRRWSAEFKRQIYNSRIGSTKLLSESFSQLESPPKIFVCASAIGFYGHRPQEALDEDSKVGSGFLANLCSDWESACVVAKDAGVTVTNARIGVVLDKSGGALKKMLLPFSLGLGGILGNGKQYMSWISLTDLVAALKFIVEKQISGPVNLTAPNPVTNYEFTKTLASQLKRPSIFPVPGFVLKTLVGEFAEEALLCSAKVLPNKLTSSGFSFQHPKLKLALDSML